MSEVLRSKTAINDCPAGVEVALNPNSYALKYVKKWSGASVITQGSIDCPAVRRNVKILVGSDGNGVIKLFCRELMNGKCEFANRRINT